MNLKKILVIIKFGYMGKLREKGIHTRKITRNN